MWQTFRLDDVMLEFTPSGFQGLGYNTGTLSIVDAGGVTAPQTTAIEVLG